MATVPNSTHHAGRRVTLVCGPPCAGKTTYVQQRAQPGDLILDQDVIGARAMREGLARVAAMTGGTAWVIRCCPGPAQRQALAQQINATNVVLLVPDKGELIHRAAHRPDPRRHIQAVRKWFDVETRPPAPAVARTPAQRQPRSRHRTGRPYRRARAIMFATYGDTCHLCGHPAAAEADHLVPISRDSTQPIDPHSMRPAHGSSCPCPVCGRCCNQSRGNRAPAAPLRTSRSW